MSATDMTSISKEQSAPSEPPQPLSETVHPPHAEHHTGHGAIIRNIIIGFADGLTVPFALTAGLSAAGSSRFVILAGLAELFAGSISMGLGASLAATTEKKHYEVEERRERREVLESPAAEEREIYEIFAKYGIGEGACVGVVETLKRDEEMWVQFMMDFELKLEKPATSKACLDGIVMGVSYLLGGLLPMIPYFAFHDLNHALFTSIGITVLVLLVFGYVKALVTGTSHKDAGWSAFQTLVVGVLAAGVSYGIVRGVNSSISIQ